MQSHVREVFDFIKTRMPSLQADGHMAYIPEFDLSLTVRVRDADDTMAVLYYWLSHPSFEEALFETTATTGNNLKNALHNGAVSFYAGLFSAVVNYLTGQEDERLETEFFGQKNIWRVTKSDLVLMGKSNPAECYWPLIAEMLAGRLGNRPFYYVKVFVAKHHDGKVTLECRVNDTLSKSLSLVLEDHANSLQHHAFCSQKQFFLLSRVPPFETYPFTKEQVENFTDQAVDLFYGCKNYEEYKALTDSLFRITDDRFLACELYSFLPEMCAASYYGDIDFAEEIILLKGEERIPVYKDGFTSYNWIHRRLMKGFQEKQYPSETYGKLITLSATYGVVKQVEKEKGKENLQNLKLSTMMSVPDDYIVR